jgi:hypothetical protein
MHDAPPRQVSREAPTRRLPSLASALMIAETITPAAPAIRMRAPFANSTSIKLDVAGSDTTAENAAASRAGPHSCCRHRNNWLTWIPAARATSDATAPGSIAAATIRRLSSADQRRRR